MIENILKTISPEIAMLFTKAGEPRTGVLAQIDEMERIAKLPQMRALTELVSERGRKALGLPA